MRAPTIAVIASILVATATGVKAQTYPVTQGKTYKFEKVADGVYYATGGFGSNNVVIVNDRDVLVVDDGTTPAAARAFLDDIKKITNKPVRTVVNTHFHYDHTDGNSVFGPEVQIIAHEYVRTAIATFDVLNREPFITSQKTAVPARIDALTKQIAAEKDPQKKAALQKDLAAAQTTQNELKEIKPTPPNVTYSSKMVLYKGSREIQLLFLGRGHTGGDTVVFLPRERIVCTGDLMESRLAYMGDAFFDEWVTTLGALKNLDFALVLPGYGVRLQRQRRNYVFSERPSDTKREEVDGGRSRGSHRGRGSEPRCLIVRRTRRIFRRSAGRVLTCEESGRIYVWMDDGLNIRWSDYWLSIFTTSKVSVLGTSIWCGTWRERGSRRPRIFLLMPPLIDFPRISPGPAVRGSTTVPPRTSVPSPDFTKMTSTCSSCTSASPSPSRRMASRE